jgi:subfamily B ATP-binding cassette protein MsbA
MNRQIRQFFEKRVNPDNTYNVGYLYLRLYQYFKKYGIQTLLSLLITIPIGALDGAIAYSLKPYIDAMKLESSLKAVSLAPLLIVGFTFLQGVLNYCSIYLNGWLGGRIMVDLRRDLFKKLQTMSVRYFDRTPSGTIIHAYFQDPQSVNTNILNNLKQMMTTLWSSLFLMGVLIVTSWKLSIIAIGILALVLYPSTFIRKIIKRLAQKTHTVSGNILSFYTETVGGIRVVYGFNMPEERLKQFNQHQDALLKTIVDYTKAQGWLTPSMHIIASVGVAAIIWQGTTMIQHHELTTGGFISFIVAMLMLYNPMKNMGNVIMTAQMSMMAAGRIFYMLDKVPEIQDKPDAVELPEIQDRIEFNDVCFTYSYNISEDLNDSTVKHISLTFKKGETVAIVGESGSGKSTIVSLIPRFYDIHHGSIAIDGVDIRDATMASLRAQIAIVNQDNFMFDGSIRDNLLVGNPQATEDDLWQALEKAHLKGFVENLEHGLDSRIGERGVMVSGGQRQRLAIARALLKDAPIVILDEATSALDSHSEIIVQKAMESLMVNRTVIVIAHRLSTIRKVDRIVVMAHGEVVETGTHDALLVANGTYARLYHSQYQHHHEGTVPLPNDPAMPTDPALERSLLPV